MPKEQELVLTAPDSLQEVRNPLDLLALALSKDAAIDVIERLAVLQEKTLAKQAEQSYFRALHEAQAEAPTIEPNKEVKTNAGKLMYKYASYEQLDRALRPIYIKHGLTISFSGAEAPAGKVRVLCCVSHRDGHAERSQLDLAIAQGGQLSNTDAELAAQSKAKRRILRNIFNIVDDLDDEFGAIDQGELSEQIEFLGNASSYDELKKMYAGYYKAAAAANDTNAMKALINAYQSKKKEF
jgi:hypothetical protein